MSDKRFDEFFKQSFSGYSPEVPPHIWENIAAGSKKKRPVGFWLTNKGAILMFTTGLLLLSAGSYFIFTKKSNVQNVVSEKINTLHQTDTTARAGGIENKPSQSADKYSNEGISPSDKAAAMATNNTSESSHGNNTPLKIDDKHVANTTISNTASTFITTRKNINQQKGELVKNNTPAHSKTTGIQKNSAETSELAAGDNIDIVTDEKETAFILAYINGTKNRIQLFAENNLPKPTIQSFIPAVKISEECPGAPGNKYYFEAYISPDYAIKKYNDTGVSSLVVKRKESLRFHSAFSAGMRYTRVFNNGMSVRTGINFSQINEKFSYAQDNVVQIIYVINNQGDTTDSYYVRGTRYKNSYNHYRTIDVPLLVGYEMGGDKFRANINAGAVVNIYSWQQGETLDNDGNPVTITTGKPANPYQYKTNLGVGFTAGASLYYKLNNRFYALAEPYFRYNFSPMNKEVLSIQEKFTTIGLRLGIRMDIK